MPLTENMPNGSATKPGDVVVASNGKTIQVGLYIKLIFFIGLMKDFYRKNVLT